MSSNNDSCNDKIHYRLSTKGESVEDINREKTDILGWDYTDVLYSFLGIYAIGVWAYCKNQHDKDGSPITINNKNNLDIELELRITKHCKIKFNKGRQEISRNYCLGHYKEFKNLNNNEELNNFIKQYETVGNLIPVWPGCNQFKGTSTPHDLASIFFKRPKIQTWLKILKDRYPNNEMGFLSERQPEDDLYNFLINMNPKKYDEWLKGINGNIKDRNKELN